MRFIRAVSFHPAHFAETTVRATLEGGQDIVLFSYYPDEIEFGVEELVGLTVDAARVLRRDRDIGYLRS